MMQSGVTELGCGRGRFFFFFHPAVSGVERSRGCRRIWEGDDEGETRPKGAGGAGGGQETQSVPWWGLALPRGSQKKKLKKERSGTQNHKMRHGSARVN